MDLLRVFTRFPDHEACIEHLERVRWNDRPVCPHCDSLHVARKADGDRIGRWNCHDCHASFNVLAHTIFQKTRLPLQKWFLGISLMLNAKKSLSSYQLARDLDLTQPTAWRMAMCIRRAMVGDPQLLTGIVEADECYVGGKPRKRNKRQDDQDAPPGRGTSKLPVIGVVERGGNVVAQPSTKVTGNALKAFLTRNVDTRGSLLITDQFPGYRPMSRLIRHATVDHTVRYADGLTHVNTIEGFWALLKRAWFGSHHHYSREYAPAYVVEACFKYNIRKLADPFSAFLRDAVAV